jgi:hypothetical protein
VVERNLGNFKESVFSEDKKSISVDLKAFKIGCLEKDVSHG